ncbi:unnamed protein product [Amoebophrya sp. A25]|nr:unnamed protein product [Amoebophrya sp. A25]|eukprot:GSA25T00008398001.1
MNDLPTDGEFLARPPSGFGPSPLVGIGQQPTTPTPTPTTPSPFYLFTYLAWCHVAFYALHALLLVLATFWVYCLRGKEACVARFCQDSTSIGVGGEEDDDTRPNLSRTTRVLFQCGYRRHWFGTCLYLFAVFLLFALQAAIWLLIIALYRPTLCQWLTKHLLDLDFVLHNATHGRQFANLGMNLILFSVWSMAVSWIFCRKNLHIWEFCLCPCPLSECTIVVIIRKHQDCEDTTTNITSRTRSRERTGTSGTTRGFGLLLFDRQAQLLNLLDVVRTEVEAFEQRSSPKEGSAAGFLSIRHVDHHLMRYVFCPDREEFRQIANPFAESFTPTDVVEFFRGGASKEGSLQEGIFTPFTSRSGTTVRASFGSTSSSYQDEASRAMRLVLLGDNALHIPVPPLISFLKTEFLRMRYVVQYHSLIWTFFCHYIVMLWQLLLTFVCGIANAIGARRRAIETAKMCGTGVGMGIEDVSILERETNTKDAPSTLLHRHQRKKIPLSHLLPGDVLVLHPDTVMPCDCVLVQGRAVMNESCLTGEPAPVQKFPVLASENDKLLRPAAQQCDGPDASANRGQEEQAEAEGEPNMLYFVEQLKLVIRIILFAITSWCVSRSPANKVVTRVFLLLSFQNDYFFLAKYLLRYTITTRTSALISRLTARYYIQKLQWGHS